MLNQIVSDIEKHKALTKDMGQVTVGAVTEAPVAATAAISPAAAQTTPSAESNAVSAANAPVVKVNFRQAVTTPDYAKPIVKTPKVTVAGVAMTFDAETHKKTCEFMKNQGLSSWVCDAAASPAPNV